MTDQAEQLLQQKLQQLPKAIAPKRDLWAGIDHALEGAEQTPSNYKWPAVAAAVAMVSLVGWLGLQNPMQEQSSYQLKDLAMQMSDQHLRQKNALLASYGNQEAVVDNWQLQMKELDDAALAIKQALQNSPNNQALLQMLQSIHQQQIHLIEKAYQPRFRQI